MDNKDSYLLICGLYPKELEGEIIRKSKGRRQDAANVMQWKFVKGFQSIISDIMILNAPYIGAYPNGYDELFIKKSYFSHDGSSCDVSIPFINFPVVRSITKYWSACSEILKFINSHKHKRRVYVLYAMNSFTVRCAKYIKKNDPESKVCLIVPDLPEYAYNRKNRSILYKFIIDCEIKISYKNIKYIDIFVGVTPFMHDRLDHTKQFVMVDAMINNNIGTIDFQTYSTNKKIILYTGTLALQYGIRDLVESVSSIDDESLELHLCGSGDKSVIEFIKYASCRDKRIVYHGLLTYKDVEVLQKRALLLINPRKPEGEYTKYSFPSKNAEYMATGIPCMFYRLDGIDNSYYEYVYQIDKFTSLRDALISVTSIDRESLWRKGIKAQEFIVENKTPEVQCMKIITAINNLYFK